MERNLNIPTKGEVARQAALQEAARALAGRPRKPVRRHAKSQVEEQGLFDALALTTSPGRPLAIKPLSIPPATAKLPSVNNVQLRNIVQPHPNDVLVGNALRSGEIFAGNVQYQTLINSQKLRYLQQTDREGKETVARDVFRAIRAQNPPGRFLRKKRRKYDDIGAFEAIEYTSQALRQGSHELAKTIAANSSAKNLPSFVAAAVPPCVAAAVSSLTVHPAPPPTLASLELFLASFPAANPPLSGEAAIRNTMLSQARGDTAFDAIAKAMNIGQFGNHEAHGETEKLAAEILTCRVRNHANVARLTEAATPPVASLIPANSSRPQLVAPSTQMPFPLYAHAGGGFLPPPPLGHDLSPSAASQLDSIPIQRTLNPLPSTRQSLVPNQLEEHHRLHTNGRNQLSCSKDLVERLVCAETMAQRTVLGTVTNELKAQEKRMGLYLDAGLLGIDHDEMTEKRKGGQSEESILEEYYAKLRRKRNHDDDGDKKRRAIQEPPTKKQRVVTTNDIVQDSDALSAVGAMIQLQRPTSDCDTETESESD